MNVSDACLRGTTTICNNPSIVSQSLPNTHTSKNFKSEFSVTGIWPFNIDIFTDEYFLPSATTDLTLQNTQNLTRTSQCYISNSYLDISNQVSTAGRKTGPSALQRNLHNVSHVKIRPFSKADAQKQKQRVSDVLMDVSVKAALEAKVESCSWPSKHNRLLSDSQEKTQESREKY